MKTFDKNTVYFCSRAKLPCEMPSAHPNQNLDIGLIINFETGVIEDMSCSLITEETKNFLKSIIVGYSINELGIDLLLEEINKRFFGGSQKAVCVILRGIYEKYIDWQKSQLLVD